MGEVGLGGTGSDARKKKKKHAALCVRSAQPRKQQQPHARRVALAASTGLKAQLLDEGLEVESET